MAGVRERRARIYAGLGGLGVISVLSLFYLLLPNFSSPVAKAEELRQLELERQTKTKQVAPLSGIDQKLVAATRQIGQFYEQRFPERGSDIVQRIGELADEHEVELGSVKYTAEDTDVPGLQRVGIEASLAGGYRDLVSLINALERDKMFFVIGSVGLAGQTGGEVRLALRLETFRKV